MVVYLNSLCYTTNLFLRRIYPSQTHTYKKKKKMSRFLVSTKRRRVNAPAKFEEEHKSLLSPPPLDQHKTPGSLADYNTFSTTVDPELLCQIPSGSQDEFFLGKVFVLRPDRCSDIQWKLNANTLAMPVFERCSSVGINQREKKSELYRCAAVAFRQTIINLEDESSWSIVHLPGKTEERQYRCVCTTKLSNRIVLMHRNFSFGIVIGSVCANHMSPKISTWIRDAEQQYQIIRLRQFCGTCHIALDNLRKKVCRKGFCSETCLETYKNCPGICVGCMKQVNKRNPKIGMCQVCERLRVNNSGDCSQCHVRSCFRDRDDVCDICYHTNARRLKQSQEDNCGVCPGCQKFVLKRDKSTNKCSSCSQQDLYRNMNMSCCPKCTAMYVKKYHFCTMCPTCYFHSQQPAAVDNTRSTRNCAGCNVRFNDDGWKPRCIKCWKKR